MGEVQNISYGVIGGLFIIIIVIILAVFLAYLLCNNQITCFKYAGKTDSNCPSQCVNKYCNLV